MKSTGGCPSKFVLQQPVTIAGFDRQFLTVWQPKTGRGNHHKTKRRNGQGRIRQ
jgi:hypothetical protein